MAAKRRSFDDLEPRSYQLAALQRAKAENTIACLQTGTGKTLIAVLLIRSLSHVFRKPEKGICVFLAPNVCLCQQQAEVIERYTDLHIGKLFGGSSMEWKLQAWTQFVQENEVFVMTPELLLRALRHGFIQQDMIELLVFDECHHAVKGHPYARIMTEFYHEPFAKTPRVFGMTASPIVEKGRTFACESNIRDKIEELEETLCSKLYAVTDEELSEYLPTSNLKIKRYHSSYTGDSPVIICQKEVDRLYQAAARKLFECNSLNGRKCLSKMHELLTHSLMELGLWCSKQVLLDEISGTEPCPVIQGFLTRSMEVLDSCGLDDQAPEACYLSPKVQLLLDVMDEYEHCQNLNCIVFVERVPTARVLAFLLNQRTLFNCKCLASHQNRKMSRTAQRNAVEEFRTGKVNILVSTNVAEEGLDIEACVLVVRFDLPKTERSNIQSRGRARQPGSDYVIFVQAEDLQQERLLESLLEGEKLIYGHARKLESSFRQRYTTSNLEEAYYRVESTGAIVNMDSSISLLHHYCSLLSKGNPANPDYCCFKGPNGFTCRVSLPETSAVKAVTGRECVSGNLAKRAASLEACKQLHLAGGLDDHLVPSL